MPATDPLTASAMSSFDASWLETSTTAVGTISHVTHLRIWSIPCRSSERTNVNRRASSASRRAYDWPPTCSARYRPLPAVTKLPERTSSPCSFATGSASPDSREMSTSNPLLATTVPSTTIWSPGPASTRSPTTTSSTRTVRLRPSRTTVAAGATRTERRSSVRLARSSCTIPITAFVTSTMPNSASWMGPTTRITTSSPPRIALKRVSTLACTIARTDRVDASATVLPRPAAWRAAASRSVRPAQPGAHSRCPGSARSVVTVRRFIGWISGTRRTSRTRHSRVRRSVGHDPILRTTQQGAQCRKAHRPGTSRRTRRARDLGL